MRGSRVALASGIFNQTGIAGAKDVLGAVTQADLELAGEDDDELAARRWMPVLKSLRGLAAKRNVGGR